MSEPQAELGPAMRALHPRWQKAVTALFLTKGNRTAALRIAGYKSKPNSMNVLASRIFADDRVRAAIREVAAHMIEVAEPELLAITLDIMRDTGTRPADRLAAARMVWDRANPVMSKHKIEVEHHLTNDERDMQHYRALQRLGAPQEAFLARFGHAGIARVLRRAQHSRICRKSACALARAIGHASAGFCIRYSGMPPRQTHHAPRLSHGDPIGELPRLYAAGKRLLSGTVSIPRT